MLSIDISWRMEIKIIGKDKLFIEDDLESSSDDDFEEEEEEFQVICNGF